MSETTTERGLAERLDYPVMFTPPGENDQGSPKGAELLTGLAKLPLQADGYRYAAIGPETTAELHRIAAVLAEPREPRWVEGLGEVTFDDLVEQIRRQHVEIERLQAEAIAQHDRAAALDAASERAAALEDALRPFAREADEWHGSAKDGFYPYIADHDPSGTILPATFTVGDLRAARALLADPSESAHTPTASETLQRCYTGDDAVRPAAIDAERVATPPMCDLPPAKYGCELEQGHGGPCRALVGTQDEVSWEAAHTREEG